MMERLLTEQQLAPVLGVAVYTLRRWRSSRKGPPYVRLDGSVRYRPSDIEAWIAERRIDPNDRAKLLI